MPRLTKDQSSAIVSEYQGGAKAADLMKNYDNTKQAYYRHVNGPAKILQNDEPAVTEQNQIHMTKCVAQ